MRKTILLLRSIIAVLLLISGLKIGITTVSGGYGTDGVQTYSYHTQESINSFSLTSPNFTNGSYIPEKYTCKGLNINPELEISEIPDEAQSLVLIMDDPDAVEVAGFVWVHWLLWNISPSITVIEENSVPDNAIQGLNSWSTTNYGGPCPPEGRDHHYFFKLYALDIELSISRTSVDNLMEAMEGHVIKKTVLTGRFSQSGPPSSTTTDQRTPGVDILTLFTSFTVLSLLYKRKKGSKTV